MRFKYDSTPIENYLPQLMISYSDAWDKFHKEYKELCLNNRPPIKSHKEKLGRQTYCWNGSEFRYWIWETEKWRCFVSNKKGICFEVKLGLDPEEAIKLWNEYRERMK